MKKGSAGGIARGIISRREALDRYYANPNYCRFCHKVIRVSEYGRVADTRSKQFCNKSCAARLNNQLHPKRHKIEKSIKKPRVLREIIGGSTKGQLFGRTKNWQSARSIIRAHAKGIYLASKQPMVCKACGYDKYVEIIHVKPVSEFSDDTLISVINDITNLSALCPNHHWEFDHGLLTI